VTRTHFFEDAVSPVVGVMLMLAVTVMIAAVVSAFAGGFSDTGEKVPQASSRSG
jgi:FlaG/FlaF family flagellin (archaellin)